MSEYISLPEACRRMNRSRKHVRKLIVSGVLEGGRRPGERAVQVKAASVEAWLGQIDPIRKEDSDGE